MNRGPFTPRVRARWTEGARQRSDWAPPVWIRPIGCIAALVVVIDDLPVPITVTDMDMTWGQWSYQRGPGGVFWHGTWRVLTATGDWWLRQELTSGYECAYHYKITYGSDPSDQYLKLSYDPQVQFGDWIPTNSLPPLEHVEDWRAPWIPFLCAASFNMVGYSDLRAEGIDPDDTRPVSWDGSVPGP